MLHHQSKEGWVGWKKEWKEKFHSLPVFALSQLFNGKNDSFLRLPWLGALEADCSKMWLEVVYVNYSIKYLSFAKYNFL